MFFNIFLEMGLLLVFLLAILLVLLFLRAKEKKTSAVVSEKTVLLDLASIVKQIKSGIQSTEELEENLAIVLEHYGTIDNYILYEKLLVALIVSPYTNKKIILAFDKELSSRNPIHKNRISDTVVEALHLR